MKTQRTGGLERTLNKLSRLSRLVLYLSPFIFSGNSFANHGHSGTYAAFNHRWEEAQSPDPGWRRNHIITIFGEPYGFQEVEFSSFIDSTNSSLFANGYWTILRNGIGVRVDLEPLTIGQQQALGDNDIAYCILNSSSYPDSGMVENFVEMWIRSHLRNPVSVDEEINCNEINLMKVFPNPYDKSLGGLKIFIPDYNSGESLKIFNSIGRNITPLNLVKSQGDYFTIDLHDLEKGVYYLRYKDQTSKLVIKN